MTERDQLVERLADFATALDTRDWDWIRSVYTAAAHAYGKDGGPDAIVSHMRSYLDGVGPTQHLLGNHRVEVDADRARTLTYVRVHHVGAGPMEGSFYECMGEYDDRWVRDGDSWLLDRRSFEIRIGLGDFAVLRGAD